MTEGSERKKSDSMKKSEPMADSRVRRLVRQTFLTAMILNWRLRQNVLLSYSMCLDTPFIKAHWTQTEQMVTDRKQVQLPQHSGNSATIQESNHGSGVCKENYA